jgi:hypothetical protein
VKWAAKLPSYDPNVNFGIGVLLAVILCCWPVENIEASTGSEPLASTSHFLGCYGLTVGRWWPWSFGDDPKNVTPPSRIELLPERGTERFTPNGNAIRILPSAKKSAWCYWQQHSDQQFDLVCNDGFTGVTVKFTESDGQLRGWAHPHFDSGTFIPRIARVSARRTKCE